MSVYAVDLSNPNINPAAQFSSIGTILNIILPLFMLGGSLLFLVMLLYGAYTYMTAGGSPENIKKAKLTITFSVLGLALVISSYVIVKLIGIIFNIDIKL
ncbi:hypothetical protein HGA88_02435 [Candidatus Roizmanbacteria bacterium]|nr:hypothetical protein [Candidatus Roizmanbacteria bacterium]